MGGERGTELEDLLDGERATVQREENLLVAGGEVACDEVGCHSEFFCIPYEAAICLNFTLHG